MSDLFGLIKRMGSLRKYVFLLLLRSPFDALRTWMLANLMKTTFHCLETNDADRLFAECMTYGLICALMFFYNGTIWSIYAAFSVKLEAGLQKAMIQKIMSMPYQQVESHFSGEWITKLNSDIQEACMMMNGPLNIPHAVVAVINTILSSFLICRSSFLLFCITWLLMIPYLFLNDQIVLKEMPNLKEESQRVMAESTSAIKPLITEAESILIYDAGGLMMQKCEKSSLKLMKVNQNMHRRNALSGAVIRLFGCGGYFVILMIGYDSILAGRMSFADVVYCIQARSAILAGMFMLITSINNIKTRSVCVRRIKSVL
ncbi:MAG: ABC transporter ATP-binding protein [Lachnospiraceae bacterium]|nr:ABC transporter ATP-binding protein [Lachnospiraceae bacterium]